MIDKWDGMPIQSNTVVEFAYNVDKKQWIPLRTRI